MKPYDIYKLPQRNPSKYSRVLEKWLDACHDCNDCNSCDMAELCRQMWQRLDAFPVGKWNQMLQMRQGEDL